MTPTRNAPSTPPIQPGTAASSPPSARPGIFCRPSCRVRKPLRKNVSFLPDAAAARAAGYRPACAASPTHGTTVTLRDIATPIGRMTIGATDGVVLSEFTERPMMPAQLATVRRRIGPTVRGDSPLLDAVETQLREYFAGRTRDFDLPIDLPGSAFQERVWAELRRIPYGETITYRELAERVDAGGRWARSAERTGRTGWRSSCPATG